MLMLICAPIPLAAEEEGSAPGHPEEIAAYVLADGVIMARLGIPARIIRLDGRVLAIRETSSGLYFLKYSAREIESPKSLAEEIIEPSTPRGFLSVGFIPMGKDAPAFEIAVPSPCREEDFRRFVAQEDTVYVLVGAGLRPGGFLYRISMNSRHIYTRENVLDFNLAGDSLILLERDGDELLLNCNGETVPCSFTSSRTISNNIDRRLAVITDGAVSELIDIRRKMNLYRYGRDENFAVPDAYNLVFQALDEKNAENSPAAEGNLIFYKIIIDGMESGRTETGLGNLMREYALMVEPGRYHIVTAERWELDKKKQQYVRVNNILQPKPMKLYIPENGIIRIRLSFRGGEYSVHAGLVAE
jgi:hypothetical protein